MSQQKFLMGRCLRLSQLFGYCYLPVCAHTCTCVHSCCCIQCGSARTQPLLAASQPQTQAQHTVAKSLDPSPGANAFTGTTMAMLGFGVWRLPSQTSGEGLGIVHVALCGSRVEVQVSGWIVLKTTYNILSHRPYFPQVNKLAQKNALLPDILSMQPAPRILALLVARHLNHKVLNFRIPFLFVVFLSYCSRGKSGRGTIPDVEASVSCRLVAS